MLKLSDN